MIEGMSEMFIDIKKRMFLRCAGGFAYPMVAVVFDFVEVL
jgi:hypothetical protein